MMWMSAFYEYMIAREMERKKKRPYPEELEYVEMLEG